MHFDFVPYLNAMLNLCCGISNLGQGLVDVFIDLNSSFDELQKDILVK